jgi:hypothetical protein
MIGNNYLSPLLVISIITLTRAYTWVEELSAVNSTGGLIGTPGYPRGFGLPSCFPTRFTTY